MRFQYLFCCIFIYYNISMYSKISIKPWDGLVRASLNLVRALLNLIMPVRTRTCSWAPVLCRLADHPDFLQYMILVEKTVGPWFKLSVFGKLGLNNKGRLAARENRKVFCKPFIHFLARQPAGMMRHLTNYPRAGDGGSSASRTTISSKSCKKTSSLLLSCIKTSHSFFLLLLSHDQHCLEALPAPCSVTSMVS